MSHYRGLGRKGRSPQVGGRVCVLPVRLVRVCVCVCGEQRNCAPSVPSNTYLSPCCSLLLLPCLTVCRCMSAFNKPAVTMLRCLEICLLFSFIPAALSSDSSFLPLDLWEAFSSQLLLLSSMFFACLLLSSLNCTAAKTSLASVFSLVPGLELDLVLFGEH